jgi:hypothetical protein
MVTLNLRTMIDADGKMRLEIPCSLPPGPADVVVVIRPAQAVLQEPRWIDYYGLGKEMWNNEDAQEYINRLRDEWSDEPA